MNGICIIMKVVKFEVCFIISFVTNIYCDTVTCMYNVGDIDIAYRIVGDIIRIILITVSKHFFHSFTMNRHHYP